MAEFFYFFLDTKEFNLFLKIVPSQRNGIISTKLSSFLLCNQPVEGNQKFASLPKNSCFLRHQFDLCEIGFRIHIDQFCIIFHSNLLFTNIRKTGYLIINFLSHCVWIRSNMMDKVSPSHTYWFVIIKVVSLYEHRFIWTLKQSLIISSS